MRIIPVLDLMQGQVVRGIGGRREEYRPIVSRLTSSSEPLAVAEAFRCSFGLTSLYVADLDAIAGGPPALDLYAALLERGFQLAIDAGVCDRQTALPLVAAEIERIVVGLETLWETDPLKSLCEAYGERIIFSLDLKNGVPLGNHAAWHDPTPWGIAEAAIQFGVTRLIVLDLAQVGGGQGIGTEELCQRLSRAFPTVELIAGGGVRGREDLVRLQECGVHAALVTSALHDGRLDSLKVTRQDVH